MWTVHALALTCGEGNDFELVFQRLPSSRFLSHVDDRASDGHGRDGKFAVLMHEHKMLNSVDSLSQYVT